MAFDLANLRLRIISALVLAPLALLGVYLGGFVFAVLVILASGAALWEWLKLIDAKVPHVEIACAITSLLLIVIVTAAGNVTGALVLGALMTVILFFLTARRDKNRAFWSAFGIPYVAGSACALVYLRSMPEGMALVCYLFVVVWGTDIGAYIAGRLIGGPKLAPRISPQKTYAGLFGGMALAALFGYTLAAGLKAGKPLAAIGIAIAVAGIAQAGDFFKSYFKRRAGVKDSGHLIPGHGGVLDRIDGLIFAAIFFVIFQTMIGANMGWW